MFEKGKSGNPKGRPKGSANRATTSIKTRLEWLITSKWDHLEKDFDSLKPYERLKMMERLLSYVLPKQAAVDVKSQIEEESKALEKLIDVAPDEFIDKIANKILKIQEAKKNG